MCMFIAIVRISIKAIKFEDMTVTFQPINPSKPIIMRTEKKQLKSGINTHNKLLNTNHNVHTIKIKTPAPNTIISFFILNSLMMNMISMRYVGGDQ